MGATMSCEIITGRKYQAARSSNGEDTKSVALFDSKSSKVTSHVVSVAECSALKITTFALPDGKHLKIHRVYTGGGEMPLGSGCGCSCEDGSSSRVLFSELLKIDCKEVRIDNCTGVLFLTIPGDYMFELSDESVLGQFVAFAEEVDCCCIPSGLVIGNQVPSERIVGTVRS